MSADVCHAAELFCDIAVLALSLASSEIFVLRIARREFSQLSPGRETELASLPVRVRAPGAAGTGATEAAGTRVCGGAWPEGPMTTSHGSAQDFVLLPVR